MRRKGFTSKNGRSSDGGRGGLTRLSNQRLYSPQMEWHGPERDQRGSQTNLGSSAISALLVTFAVYWDVHSSLCPPSFSSPNDCLGLQPPVFVYILIKVNLRRRLLLKFSGDYPKLIGHASHRKAESHSKARLTIENG